MLTRVSQVGVTTSGTTFHDQPVSELWKWFVLPILALTSIAYSLAALIFSWSGVTMLFGAACHCDGPPDETVDPVVGISGGTALEAIQSGCEEIRGPGLDG